MKYLFTLLTASVLMHLTAEARPPLEKLAHWAPALLRITAQHGVGEYEGTTPEGALCSVRIDYSSNPAEITARLDAAILVSLLGADHQQLKGSTAQISIASSTVLSEQRLSFSIQSTETQLNPLEKATQTQLTISRHPRGKVTFDATVFTRTLFTWSKDQSITCTIDSKSKKNQSSTPQTALGVSFE